MPKRNLQQVIFDFKVTLDALYEQLPKSKQVKYDDIQLVTTGAHRGLQFLYHPVAGKVLDAFAAIVQSPKWLSFLPKSTLFTSLKIIITDIRLGNINLQEKAIANAFVKLLEDCNHPGVISEIFVLANRFWPNLERLVGEVVFPLIKPLLTVKNLELINSCLDLMLDLLPLTADPTFNSHLIKLKIRILSKLDEHPVPSVVKTALNSIIDNIITSSDLSLEEKKQAITTIKIILANIANNKKLNKKLFFDFTGQVQPYISNLVSDCLKVVVHVAKDLINTVAVVETIKRAIIKLEASHEEFASFDIIGLKAKIQSSDTKLVLAVDRLIEAQQIIKQDIDDKRTSMITVSDRKSKIVLLSDAIVQQLSLEQLVARVDSKNIDKFISDKLNTKNNKNNRNADLLKSEYKLIQQDLNLIKEKSFVELPSEKQAEILDRTLSNIKDLGLFIQTNGEESHNAAQKLVVDANKQEQRECRLFINRKPFDYGNKDNGGARLSSIDKSYHLQVHLDKLGLELLTVQKKLLEIRQPSDKTLGTLVIEDSTPLSKVENLKQQAKTLLEAYEWRYNKKQCKLLSKPKLKPSGNKLADFLGAVFILLVKIIVYAYRIVVATVGLVFWCLSKIKGLFIGSNSGPNVSKERYSDCSDSGNASIPLSSNSTNTVLALSPGSVRKVDAYGYDLEFDKARIITKSPDCSKFTGFMPR